LHENLTNGKAPISDDAEMAIGNSQEAIEVVAGQWTGKSVAI
jgi:hypothetical protein